MAEISPLIMCSSVYGSSSHLYAGDSERLTSWSLGAEYNEVDEVTTHQVSWRTVKELLQSQSQDPLYYDIEN
jgi:hypothetical protein